MFALTNEPSGRIITISLQRGEMLLEGIEQAVKETGIRDAVVLSCIGTIASLALDA